MQEVRSALAPGALVQARGEHWYVRHTRPFLHGAVILLEATEATNPQRTVTLLLPFDRPEPAADRRPVRRRRQLVVRGALDALSQTRPEHRLWTARAARVDLLPWQLAPALSVLSGVNRLLLADAVGLGKTIQAGLVLAELRTRGLVDRALILAPAALRDAWAMELTTRFELPVTVLDLPAILAFERTRAVGANPWSGAPVIVSSLDLVKRADVLAAVERAPLDLLIVDEAHHLTPGTDRHAAVSRLARQVPWVVLASATPHSGDAAAYRALMALGEVGSPPVDRLRVFRRSHGDVRFAVARRTHILRVRTSLEEQRLYDAVLAFARELCRSTTGPTDGVQLLAGVLARRATSSPVAIQRTLMRRLDGLASRGTTAVSTPPLLPWEEFDEEAGESWPALAGGSAETERDRIGELVRLAQAAGAHWSKGARLRRLVQAIGEPLIVFSEFRDSLDACRDVLEPVTSLVCLHGGVEARERRVRLTAFEDGSARVLLATDVAGEGLNLQGPSRLVITLEWPWSPLRIEQRVGRVHRLGQTRMVHVIHLTAHQSYEDTVVARALGRAARAATDLSSSMSSSHTLTTELLGLPRSPASPDPGMATIHTHDVLARCEEERIVGLRRLARLGCPLPGGAPAWAPPRRGPSSRRVVAVVEVRRTAGGTLLSCQVVPIDIRLRTAPADRREWRLVCQRVAADGHVRRTAIDATGSAGAAEPWTGVRLRLAAIREERHARAPRTVQPSLFDRRAWREACGHASVRQTWDEWQTQLDRRLPHGGEPPLITTRILALFPIGEGPP